MTSLATIQGYTSQTPYERDRAARSVQWRHTPYPERGDDSLALLISMHCEINRVSILVGVTANIANAIARGRTYARPRSILKYFPRESAGLILAMSRFSRFFAASPLRPIVEAFEDALANAKAETIKFASADFELTAGCQLGASWRSACKSASAAIAGVHSALAAYELAEADPQRSSLEALLDSAASGDDGLVNTFGEVRLPTWAERRGAMRIDLRCAAMLSFDGKSIPARICDISTSGIGIECDSALLMSRGTELTILVGEQLALEGVVAWSRDGRLGVALRKFIQTDDPRFKFCSSL